MGRVFNFCGQRSVNSWSWRRHWNWGRSVHDGLGPDWRDVYVLSSSGRISQSPSRHGLHMVGCGAFVNHFSAWHWLTKNLPLHF